MMADDERDDADTSVNEEGLPEVEEGAEEEEPEEAGTGLNEFGDPIEE